VQAKRGCGRARYWNTPAPSTPFFVSTLPLEFADRVKVRGGSNKARMEEGTVVAVQYHDGRKAIAVRFLRGQCHWVTEP
jgi:hypothetical protein